MSVVPLKADIRQRIEHVRFVPIADIARGSTQRKRPPTEAARCDDSNSPLQATIRLHIVIMDLVFKALADASRRELLDRLRADNGQTLNQLCERLAMTRQAVSKHLMILEGANLVATVKRGREKFHYLNPVPIHEIGERWIGKFERSRLQALSDMKKALEVRDD